MKVGVTLPQAGAEVSADLVVRTALAAEASGYDSLWVIDHVVTPREFRSRYPYSPDGRPPGRILVDGSLLEPLTLLTFVAAVTTRVQLGTAVLVVPMRQPVLHAKVLASLDHLAGGRLIVGAGLGWCREEVEVLGMPWPRRAQRFEESLRLMRALWTEEWVEFEGESFRVDGWTSRPQPPRHVPVWLGGNSPQQLGRVGRFADGWIAGGHSLPTLRAEFERAREAAAAAGRDPEALTVAMSAFNLLGDDRQEQTAERLHAAREAGVQHAVMTLHPRDLGHAAERVARFADRYLAEVRAEREEVAR